VKNLYFCGDLTCGFHRGLINIDEQGGILMNKHLITYDAIVILGYMVIYDIMMLIDAIVILGYMT